MQKTHSQKNQQEKTIRIEKLSAPENLLRQIKLGRFSLSEI
jgi:hypothetical protein